MKSIKIKVKTLLLILICLALLLVFGDDFYWGGISIYNQIVSEENQVELFNLETGSLEYESRRIALVLEEHNYLLHNMITFGDGKTMGSARVRLGDAESVLASYKRYDLEENLIEDHPEYVLNVVMIQWFAGNVEETLDLMNSIDPDKLPSASREHYHLIQAAIHLTFFDLEGVEESLSRVLSEESAPVVNQIKMYMHNIYGFEISYDKPGEDSHRYGDDAYDYNKYFDSIFDINEIYEYESARNSNSNNEGTDQATISGRVTLNGEPLIGAIVYMKDWKGISSSEGYTKDGAIIGEDGSYAIENKYGADGTIGFKVPWQLIHDKSIELPRDMDLRNDKTVNFEFEEGYRFVKAVIEDDQFVYEINDAKGTSETEYSMVIRHTMPNIYNDHSYFTIKGAKGSVPLIDLERDTMMTLGRVSSHDALALERLTEHLYLSGDYSFEVNPVLTTRDTYISNGTFTEALQTVVSYEGVEAYNEGDLLLADKEITAAMEWYEQHPSRHNLKALVALNRYGYIPIDGKYYQKLEGQDLKKAIEFQEQLIELDGSTTQRLNTLKWLYNDAYEYEKEGILLEEILASDPSVYDYFSYGYNLIHRGFYMEGLEVLQEHGDMAVDGDRYYSYFLLGNQVESLTGDIKLAVDRIEGLEEYEDFYSLIVSGLYHEAWYNLESREESDLKTMHQLLFLDRIEYEDLNDKLHIQKLGYEEYDFASYYRDSVNGMHDRNIKELMRLIKKKNNWF